MKTMELINFQTRIDDIIADILKISNVMIFKTLTSFKKYMGLFYRLCEDIAIIDVLQSLAEVSLRNSYVKPTFSDFTEVKESQHPMLDMLAHEKPVPNLISSSSNFNVHIITGPNGSGKSIYIRQLMLLQIMAQIGGYVPASSAVFRPADHMFARVYLEDNMECGASSFVLEMKEIIYILSHITDSSLIIIDELARSTSLEEGAALAMAIGECFVNSYAFVYLTSHFTLVSKLGDMYLNVKNWFMDTEASGDTPKSLKLNFKHIIKPGVTNLKRYGIFIVKNIWPADLLEDVYTLVEHNTKAQKEIKTQQLSRESRLKYNIDSDLRMLKVKGKLNPSKINELLNHYQVDVENIDLNIGDLCEKQIREPAQESVSQFDDTVPDDILSEAMDQVENSLMSPRIDSNNSSYKQLSYFIGENSENIHLLHPEVYINEPSANFVEETNPVGFNFNERAGTLNPNIKILSNVVLNGKTAVQENNPHCNNQLTLGPNLSCYSQDIPENSQEFEEMNEINRSLLTEMHIARENFREINSETLHEDTLTEKGENLLQFDFTDTNRYNRDQKSITEIIPSENYPFGSFVDKSSQVSDFSFLKPSEPPLRKRFSFKAQFSREKNDNLDETDQLTFSLGLIQSRDKTSTPINSGNHGFSQEDQKMNFTAFSDNKFDYNSSYPTGCIFSQGNSQSWLCEPPMNKTDQSMNVGNNTEQGEFIDSIDEVNNEGRMESQQYNLKTSKEYIENKQNIMKNPMTCDKVHSDSQENESCIIDEGTHIFPEINIVQGLNNKSLSFGEEDKPLKILRTSKLSGNIKDKNVTLKDKNIDKDLEQFVIEETKIFLSDSVDIFDGDVDELEITIENNKYGKKSLGEVSENVISILNSKNIPSEKDRGCCDINEDILIRASHPELDDKVVYNLHRNSVVSETDKINDPVQDVNEEENIKEKVVLEEPKANEFENSDNRRYDRKNQHSKYPHNLFEESDLDNFLNNDLTISKTRTYTKTCNVQNKSANHKLSPPIAKIDTNNDLIKTSNNFDDENKSGHNQWKKTVLENFGSIKEKSKCSDSTSISHPSKKRFEEGSSNGRNNKNTVSISLSEASRKRKLDNSTSGSTSFSDEDDFEMSYRKEKVGISRQNNKLIDVPSTSSKSPSSIVQIRKLQTPSRIPTSENNESLTSNSRDMATTSISDASRKRNLDNPTSTSTSSKFQDVSIDGEKKSFTSTSLSEKLKELISPKMNNFRKSLNTKSVPEIPEKQQEISDEDYKDCKDDRVKKDSDSSQMCYETAAKTHNFSEKSDSDELQHKECEKKSFNEDLMVEVKSERFASTPNRSTQTFSDSFNNIENGRNVNAKNETILTDVAEKGNNCSVPSNADSLNKDSSSQTKKMKYLGYGRRPKQLPKVTKTSKKKGEDYKNCKRLFRPGKLTKYQIQEEFDRQDQVILEENLDIETYKKYLEQRMNRPSVKQIQNAEHIATFRRTENGTIILPSSKKPYKPRKSSSTKIFETNKLIDVSIFSDQNANKMSAFLASKETNYNQFKFEESIQRMAFDEDSHSVNFCSQFVQKRKRIQFNRSKSFGDFNFRKFTGIYNNSSFKFEADVDLGKFQQSQSSSIFLPDGYFKKNKKDIDLICSKYLNDSNSGFYRTRTSPLS